MTHRYVLPCLQVPDGPNAKAILQPTIDILQSHIATLDGNDAAWPEGEPVWVHMEHGGQRFIVAAPPEGPSHYLFHSHWQRDSPLDRPRHEATLPEHATANLPEGALPI